MEKYTMFMDWKNHYSENEYTTQSNLQIQCNPYQATNGIFHIARKNSEEELKSPLMKVKVESEKVALQLNIQKTKIMASDPITPWEIDGETVETVSDFILGGSKITTDGDCSHEIKRRLLLGRKVMTNLDSIFKQRHYFAD